MVHQQDLLTETVPTSRKHRKQPQHAANSAPRVTTGQRGFRSVKPRLWSHDRSSPPPAYESRAAANRRDDGREPLSSHPDPYYVLFPSATGITCPGRLSDRIAYMSAGPEG